MEYRIESQLDNHKKALRPIWSTVVRSKIAPEDVLSPSYTWSTYEGEGDRIRSDGLIERTSAMTTTISVSAHTECV